MGISHGTKPSEQPLRTSGVSAGSGFRNRKLVTRSPLKSFEMGLQDEVELDLSEIEEVIAIIMMIGPQTLEPLRDRHFVRKELPQVLE